MFIFGILAVYGFMMAQSPPKLLANLTKLCRNYSYMTLLNNCSNSLVQCIQVTWAQLDFQYENLLI